MNEKVMIVSYNLSMGGLQRASAVLADQLIEHHANVIYYSVTLGNHFFSLNAKVLLIEPTHPVKLFSIAFFKVLWHLRINIKRVKPDAILVFSKFLGAFTILATYGLGVRVVLTDRMSPTRKDLFYIELFNRLVYWLKKPDAIIAQTQLAATYQNAYFCYKVPITVIPNTIRPVELFPDIVRKPFILAVGRLNDLQKGFDRLVEAFAKVKNKEWRLVFAGGEAEGKLIKQQALNLGISERLLFLGKIKEIDRLYAEAGIFVIPSRNEGFPNALCEAMAAGLPCIAFDFVAGPREIITDGVNGIIVEDGDIETLAVKIDYLIESKSERERLGENAKCISERFSLEEISKQYLNSILG